MEIVRRSAQAFLSSDGVRRALWTLAQAGVGVAAAEAANLPPELGAVVAFGLSALKSAIAARRAKAVE